MRTRLTIALATVSLLLVPAAPAVAAPVDDQPPVLRSLALSQSSVTVSGLQTVLVTVTARLTDQTGVYSGVTSDGVGRIYWTPSVWFAGEPAFLRLASGTPQDGIWTGQLPVTSAWTGTSKPTQVIAEDTEFQQLRIDPASVVSVPAITVRSSHRPVVRVRFSPDPATPGQPVTEHVSVTDSETGAPVSYAPLQLAYDSSCVEDVGTPGRTGLFGTYQTAVPIGLTLLGGFHCVWVVGDDSFRPTSWPTIIASTSELIRYRYVVTATPGRTSVPAGTNVTVSGTLKPRGPKTVQLQRLSGSTWRTVNTAIVDDDGGFTVLATPPGKATYSYRVHAPADDNVAGTSATFTIRGT